MLGLAGVLDAWSELAKWRGDRRHRNREPHADVPDGTSHITRVLTAAGSLAVRQGVEHGLLCRDEQSRMCGHG